MGDLYNSHSTRPQVPSRSVAHLPPTSTTSATSASRLNGDTSKLEDSQLLSVKREELLKKCISVNDYQVAAKQLLSKPVYEYIASGTEDEQTLNENQMAFKRFFLRPRMLKNVKDVSTSISLFGQKLSMPVLITPAGVHKVAYQDGEISTTRAAKKIGTIMSLSQHATCTIEEISMAYDTTEVDVVLQNNNSTDQGRLLWYQCYILKDRNITKSLIKRAERMGYTAIILTVDSPRFGFREADERNNFTTLPPGLSLVNYDMYHKNKTSDHSGYDKDQSALYNKNHNNSNTGKNRNERIAWDQQTELLFDDTVEWITAIPWLRSITALPIIVKGILTAEDACEAVKYGAQGIIISNHGGRQLDGALSSIEVLEEIVLAVREKETEKTVILLDSGVRRGTDVVKALALGADAVLIGKPVFFSLAVGGSEGVYKMLSTLKEEIETTMALCGCRSIQDIDRGKVVQKSKDYIYFRPKL